MNDISDFSYPSGPSSLAPAAAILASGEGAFARARNGLEAAGWRTMRADGDALRGPLWIELDGPPDAATERALVTADRGAGEDGLTLVVAAPREALDTLAALVTAPASELLIAPSPVERAAAAATLFAFASRPAGRAFEASRDLADLKVLSAEMSRIAETLAKLSAADTAMEEVPAAPVRGDGVATAVDPSRVRALIRERRLRSRFFDAALFADPAWDMLLDLYSAQLDGSRVPVSSLCAAADVPPTTALRWIRGMTAKGLFERQPDPTDARRVFVALSEAAESAMGRYFAAVG